MLGERQNRWVSQSAWIKSLTASFVRSWDGRSGTSGGLFGGRSKNEGEVLGWSRAQQAAFLIFAWRSFADAVAATKEVWAENLRNPPKVGEEKLPGLEDVKADDDPAFFGTHSLITTDQGVRGFLHVVNDLSYQRASKLKLNTWVPDDRSSANPVAAVESSLKSLAVQEFVSFVTAIGNALASFDWRTSSAPGLDEQKRRAKLVFRGSGGYKELRTQLLKHLASEDNDLASVAKRLLGRS